MRQRVLALVLALLTAGLLSGVAAGDATVAVKSPGGVVTGTPGCC